MLPNNILSSSAVPADFIAPKRANQLVDYEYGSFALQNTESGLDAVLWKCFYEGGLIKFSHLDQIQIMLTVDNVTALSFAFDLNMNPLIAYSAEKHCYLWWYDTAQAKQVTTDLGTEISFPQLSLDERRAVESSNADVIFAYIKNSKLYMRIQRERFQIEHELTQAKRLIQIGMMKNNRFGFAYYDWN